MSKNTNKHEETKQIMEGTFEQRILSFEEQADFLERKGLTINDRKFTVHILSNISYYRLSTYMMPFRERDSKGCVMEEFRPGTSWDDVYGLYIFDRKLRLLVFDAIERIEVALRTQIAYQLGAKYGNYWHQNEEIFHPKDNIAWLLKNQILRSIRSNNKNVYNAYCEKNTTPTSWRCMELITFGDLSRIVKGLKNRADRVDLARAFGISDDVTFCSWLHTINYIRNICAHHSRLWNLSLNIRPRQYFHKGGNLHWFTRREAETVDTSKMYYTICIIIFILQTVTPESKFRKKFIKLANDYPQLDLAAMGIPANWRESRIWNF